MTQKILRVCLSKDFPLLNNRQTNIIYFIYDKLLLFLGQNQYTDPYAIVEDIPETPVSGILYIIIKDGSVRSYIDYELVVIANIENQEQLELLKQSGSLFFVSSNKRYLDVQRRLVTLPYLNGTYELTVDLAKDVLIDDKTVIKYDTKTESFIIDNNECSDSFFHSDGYQGSETNSIKTVVSDAKLTTDVKISKGAGNLIRVNRDGLYATANDRVLKEQFDDWATKYTDYKAHMEYYLKDLSDQIKDISDVVSSETIATKIHDALTEVYPEIDNALSNYDRISNSIESMETNIKQYTDDKYETAMEELKTIISDASNTAWYTFKDEIDDSKKST